LLPLEHRASVKRFVSLQFLNLRQSVGLLGRVISSSQGLYLNTGQQKHIHTPNIHALCGIRIHDPGCRASEDGTCLRPLGNRDRLVGTYYLHIQGSGRCTLTMEAARSCETLVPVCWIKRRHALKTVVTSAHKSENDPIDSWVKHWNENVFMDVKEYALEFK
jgi:hypothetical protein